MARQQSGFRSRSECEKDEALSCHYGKIGIQAVAAAQSVMRQADCETDNRLPANAYASGNSTQR